MKKYIEFISEIIHQTPIANMFNEVFDVIKVGDTINLNKRGHEGEFLGYFKVLDLYNANRSLPGNDTMEVLKMDDYNIPVESHSAFPIIKEDMSYEYNVVGLLNFNGILFKYKDKYLLTHKKTKEKGKDYKHIFIEDNGSDNELHKKIISIFGFDIDFDENAKQEEIQFFEDGILKTHKYRISELTEKEFKYHFDKYKLNKNEIQTSELNDVGFFSLEESEKTIDKDLSRILKHS